MCNRSMTLPKGFCMAKKDIQFHSLLQRGLPQPLALLCGGHQHFFPTLVLPVDDSGVVTQDNRLLDENLDNIYPGE